jgi:hypothetical protein
LTSNATALAENLPKPSVQEKSRQKLWQHNPVVLFVPMLAMSVFRK